MGMRQIWKKLRKIRKFVSFLFRNFAGVMEHNVESIRNKIYEIRGQRVMLDRDLAELYGVTTGNLNKAVKRNIRRFPPDFMFQLTKEEFYELNRNLIFQNGISSWGGTQNHGGASDLCRMSDGWCMMYNKNLNNMEKKNHSP